MNHLLFGLTLLATLGSGLMAGLFFAFSAFIMKALAQLPSDKGIVAMQAINVKILNFPFLLVFLGTPAICLALVTLACLRSSEPASIYMVVGGGLHVFASIVVTAVFNVPRNNLLAAVDPTSSEGAHLWKEYVRSWTAWNHVRTVGTLTATAVLAVALGQFSLVRN